MYKKVIKKLKHYANVVCIGRSKYAQNYIDYAGGYLYEFKDVIIFDRLNLELIPNFIDWDSKDFKNGERKAYADLMAWTAEEEQKRKRRQAKKEFEKKYFELELENAHLKETCDNLQNEIANQIDEINALKQKLQDGAKTVCEELIQYITNRSNKENKCQILYLDELTLKGGAK